MTRCGRGLTGSDGRPRIPPLPHYLPVSMVTTAGPPAAGHPPGTNGRTEPGCSTCIHVYTLTGLFTGFLHDNFTVGRRRAPGLHDVRVP